MITNATHSEATTSVNNTEFATITNIIIGVADTLSASLINSVTNIAPVTDTINSPAFVQMSTTHSFASNTYTISAIAEIAIVSNVVDVTALKITCTADMATITMANFTMDTSKAINNVSINTSTDNNATSNDMTVSDYDIKTITSCNLANVAIFTDVIINAITTTMMNVVKDNDILTNSVNIEKANTVYECCYNHQCR